LEICECNSRTIHKLTQWRLTADWLAPRGSDCWRIHSKVSSEWLPSYIVATRTVLEIFKMAGYFQDSPLVYIHTYIYIYIHTYIHTYVRTYIPTYIHTHINSYFLHLNQCTCRYDSSWTVAFLQSSPRPLCLVWQAVKHILI
jgi:hypothetical protein